MCDCDCAVTVVRGDTLEYYFNIDIAREGIKRVCFKSAKTNLLVYLAYSEDDDAWCLRLLGEDTEKLKPIIANYDLVVELINGEILTVIYNNIFAVYERRNNVVEESV